MAGVDNTVWQETIYRRAQFQEPQYPRFRRACMANTPIQGTAADIIKIAMVNVAKK